MKKILFPILGLTIISVTNAQNVGIGTTTPGYKTHITGGDLFVESSSGKIIFGYNSGGSQWRMATTNGGADLRWNTFDGTTENLRHYFTQNGNVGIATGFVPPIARLEVRGIGAFSTTNTFVLRNSTGDTTLRMRDDGRMGIGYNGSSYGRVLNVGGTGINFYTAGEAGFGGAVFPTDTSLIIWSNSGANNYVSIQPIWGNTGVGTYSPKAKLHINGGVLIGGNTARLPTGYVLAIDGKAICEELKVQTSGAWPDYVFENDYEMASLEELEKQVMVQKHLPNIPSAADVKAQQGIELGDMQKRMLEKMEEMYRYMFQMNKENKELKAKVALISKKIGE